jgi:hypothetical protein
VVAFGFAIQRRDQQKDRTGASAAVPHSNLEACLKSGSYSLAVAVPLEAKRLNLQRLIGLIASKSTNDTGSLGGQGVLPCDDGGKVPGRMQGKSCDQLWLALSESKRKHHSLSLFNLEPVLYLFEHFH